MEVRMPDDDSPQVYDFDVGTLGCGTGLAAEVRRRLAAIAVGDTLRIMTRDPAAREDVPALARLLGQRVIAVEALGDTTTITVERTR
jgi:TusA-related sulfurtransferase